jgi:Flp pilus assembly protein TadG
MASNLIGGLIRQLYHLKIQIAQERGATLVYVALVLPVLIGLAGLAMDGSNLFVQQRNMQAAADAAAMAGARAVGLGQTGVQVGVEINLIAAANGAGQSAWSALAGGGGVEVQTTRTFSTYFAGALGHSTLTVTATAAASYFVVGAIDNLMPMTIMCDDMSDDSDPGFTYGHIYTFWNNDMTQPGNFGWVDWNGPPVGNGELADNISNTGRSGAWRIGDWMYAGPGVQNSSNVIQALEGWRNRQVTIPLYGAITGTGSGTRYQVCTFAEFILTDFNFSGNDKWVRGTFVRHVERGGSAAGNPPDFGLRSLRLVQ